MRKFLILARVQLWALLTSFRIGGSRKKAASGWAALALMAALCLFISGSYSFPLGEQLAAAGCLELLLMMSVMAVIMGLVFTVFAAQGVVFGGRDADLLLSMPVSAFTALLAKLTALYVENLALCAFLVLPAGAAWLWFGGGGGALFVLRLIVGTLFLALLPTLLSLAGGFLLSWLGGRFANRRAVNLLLYGLMAAAVFFLAVRMNMAVAVLAAGAMGAEAEGAFAGWGVPFLLFQRGVCGDWETLAMFCLLSLAPVLAAAWLFARNYQRVLTGLSSHGRRPAYRLGRLKAAGRRKALLRKEADRYFGTPIYLLNTGIGLILLVVAGIAAAVMGGSLRDRLAQAGLGSVPLLTLAAGAIGFMLSTVAITGSSISLEGRNLWIIKESPVSASEALGVKAGFQLLLACPCAALCAAGLAFIVLYNLTNINITERIREIATIKVLGFYRRETNAYVFRENVLLSALGMALGLGLGHLLHRFVMSEIRVDMIAFHIYVRPISYVYSGILTLLFAWLVNLAMGGKLESISMTESLKSVD